MPVEIRPLYAVRADLSETDAKIIYRNCLVIPSVLQSEVLERIHDGHQVTSVAKDVIFGKIIYLLRERNHLLLYLLLPERA